MGLVEPHLAGQSVSRETSEKLRTFSALVQRWTPAVNLVSKSSVADLWDRHIVDSAQVFFACPPDVQTWVDLGSGGGFPGLVVAILAQEAQPHVRVALVESDLRKATFLRQAAEALRLDIEVHSERIESLSPQNADVVSARALAPLPQLLGYVDRHLRRGGTAILPKGARHAEEVAAAREDWSFSLETRPSPADPNAAILVIRDLKRARQ